MSSIFAFFVLICVLVFVHEYGHFWAARRCGVKVVRFSIGFGKVLFRKTDKHGTEFAFSLIPLGGYVQMYNGEEDVNAQPKEAVANKTIWQRAFIIIAGPVANFLFALFAYWVVFMAGVPTVKPVIGEIVPNSIAAHAKLPVEFELKKVQGQNVADWEEAVLALTGNVGSKQVKVEGDIFGEEIPKTFELDLSQWNVDSRNESPLLSLGIRPKSSKVLPEIQNVVEASPAAKAGLKTGDLILKVNHQPFDWQALIEQVKQNQPIVLDIQNANGVQRVELTPEQKEGRYIIGIMPKYEPLAEKYRTELKYDVFTAFAKSFEKVTALIKTICQFIGNLMSGDLSVKNMGGVVSMAKGAGATAEFGWVYYLGFMALISVNLGVMNLFPILPLDGGQLILLAIEAVRRKPLSQKIQLGFQQIGVILVIGLMVFALINDIIHF